jgi:hypothetical protein
MLFVLELRGTGLGKGRDIFHNIFYFRRELAEFSPQLYPLSL